MSLHSLRTDADAAPAPVRQVPRHPIQGASPAGLVAGRHGFPIRRRGGGGGEAILDMRGIHKARSLQMRPALFQLCGLVPPGRIGRRDPVSPHASSLPSNTLRRDVSPSPSAESPRMLRMEKERPLRSALRRPSNRDPSAGAPRNVVPPHAPSQPDAAKVGPLRPHFQGGLPGWDVGTAPER